ncbi:class I SAM-dependent methyltransferase [Aspergillus homomorphus CBS 101889]|uniref:S-adenosyl-L-methionine-dependent methyltransferase n=1 Tax=Aspergillus homomorphus (strain CBS 101889) TaxID=1450537 RepID=A0A395HPU3_ASPHC|nr:S-adenosyl-L-methionine-dependent methyltransferase [Aspergillus homomorphus CBS 101889]RAL08878.1 S-adenosyl-L-methionine-dependent methyltransferase [Aspergillus homomorphus CBS 101889]
MTVSTPTSEVATRQSTCYNSPYLAEYYDSWIWDRGDLQYFSRILQEQLAKSSLPAHTPFCILDVGTGTGRVLRHLSTTLPQGLSKPINLVGLEIEPHMLDRARRLQSEIKSQPEVVISWVQGSAFELSAAPPFSSSSATSSKVDILLFPFGSLAHFTEPGQAERFFTEVAKVLRPGTGRAYIPLLHKLLIDDGDITELAEQALYPAATVTSKEYPGVTYYEKPLRHGVEGNQVHHTRFIEVVKDGDVVERNVDDLVLKLWKTKEVCALAMQAGLVKVEQEAVDDEIFFVFQLPG